eukprot:10816664-Alexandrium_andersonii.AAC.1
MGSFLVPITLAPEGGNYWWPPMTSGVYPPSRASFAGHAVEALFLVPTLFRVSSRAPDTTWEPNVGFHSLPPRGS